LPGILFKNVLAMPNMLYGQTKIKNAGRNKKLERFYWCNNFKLRVTFANGLATNEAFSAKERMPQKSLLIAKSRVLGDPQGIPKSKENLA